MVITRRTVLATALASSAGVVQAATDAVSLAHASGRRTAYRTRAPGRPGVWPVILFSHGANSSSRDYDRLWSVWAERGYFVIGPDHIDTGPPASQPKLGPGELWRARVDDVALPLKARSEFDRLARGGGGRLDWSAVCAAGHSFGAVVAQALVGAKLETPGVGGAFAGGQRAVRACLAFSPPGPRPGFVPADAWSPVRVPSLLQTGDADVLPGFVDDWRTRLTGFAGAPDRWVIVGRGVDHYFGGLICRLRADAGAQSAALSSTAAISADFLDAYVKRDPRALAALSARASKPDDGVAKLTRA